MTSAHKRICSRTGLALTSGPDRALRIARESYGPLNPRTREEDDDRLKWSRYDTLGQTIYACADRVTAYMELLAPYRTAINDERRALKPLADALGIEIDQLWSDVVTEWDEQGWEAPDWLPRRFRSGRAVYNLQFPAGWWIDITATETITALADVDFGAGPRKLGPAPEPLTLSHLTGDDRVLTTSIADFLRNRVTLDDGTQPLGVEFLSKHGAPSAGSGICWAFWMSASRGRSAQPPNVTRKEPINDDDSDLIAAQTYCKIKIR